MRSSFTIRVTHAGIGLPGVSLQIVGTGVNGVPEFLYRMTGRDGAARFDSLEPGDYSIRGDLLGVWAGYECFHINRVASRSAKNRRTLQWGESPTAAHMPEGRIVESQPGKDGTPLQRLIHRITAPVSDSKLELRSPKGPIYFASSDVNGRFAFADVPDGIYVLHIEGGNESNELDDFLLNLSHQEKPLELLVTRRDAGGGSCGGAGLEVVERRKS